MRFSELRKTVLVGLWRGLPYSRTTKPASSDLLTGFV
jgi:hypothetical protein